MMLDVFVACHPVLIVEMVSLVAGIQLSRSMTGAVHELYEGTGTSRRAISRTAFR